MFSLDVGLVSCTFECSSELEAAALLMMTAFNSSVTIQWKIRGYQAAILEGASESECFRNAGSQAAVVAAAF